jgi:hypothetical protein
MSENKISEREINERELDSGKTNGPSERQTNSDRPRGRPREQSQPAPRRQTTSATLIFLRDNPNLKRGATKGCTVTALPRLPPLKGSTRALNNYKHVSSGKVRLLVLVTIPVQGASLEGNNSSLVHAISAGAKGLAGSIAA